MSMNSRTLKRCLVEAEDQAKVEKEVGSKIQESLQ